MYSTLLFKTQNDYVRFTVFVCRPGKYRCILPFAKDVAYVYVESKGEGLGMHVTVI